MGVCPKKIMAEQKIQTILGLKNNSLQSSIQQIRDRRRLAIGWMLQLRTVSIPRRLLSRWIDGGTLKIKIIIIIIII